MTQLTASFFALQAPTMFNSYTQNTDALVWWFARQNTTIQTQVVQGICSDKRLGTKSVIETFWALNSTFTLPPFVQTQMLRCVTSITTPQHVTTYLTQNTISGGIIFGWDSFTPKAYLWFNSQTETNQLLALNWLCFYKPPPSLVHNTLIYYQHGYQVYNTSVLQNMQHCENMLPFMGTLLSNETVSWFANQTYSIQRTAIIRVCANLNYNYGQTANAFRLLLNAKNTTQLHKDMGACLTTYTFDYAAQYYYYRPSDNESLIWFASQNITTQKRAMNYICLGKASLQTRISTISEIMETLSTISNFLAQLNLITFTVINQVEICQEFYEAYNFTTARKQLNTVSQVWLASQNESVQMDFMNGICYDERFNSSTVFAYFQWFGRLIPTIPVSVQYSMVYCPRIREFSTTFFSYMYTFIGMGVFSAICLIFLVCWIGYEWHDSIRENKRTRILTPFNILLAMCLISNILHDCSYAMVWFLSEVMNVTLILRDFEKQIWYLLSEVFLATWALSYLGFCWVRSESILKRIWTTNFDKVKWAFALSPFLLLGPSLYQLTVLFAFRNNVAGRLKLNTLNYSIQALASSVLLLMDVLLLLTFTRYVSTLYEVSSQFLVISRYGIGFSTLCFFYSALSIAKPFVQSQTIYVKISLSLLMHLVSALLLLMKVSLFYANKHDTSVGGMEKRASNQIRRAKAEVESVESGKNATIGSGLRKQSRLNSIASNGLRAFTLPSTSFAGVPE
ncbi:hypothetical protein BCR33DRAFT_761438, partial [Rhizoclosmatium globosum]